MRLILGDDHAIFLDALASVLVQHGYQVAAVARSPHEMLALARRERPDACIVDSADLGTIRAAAELATVVVLSADPDPGCADRVLTAGAAGYLHQSCGVEALVGALKRILDGEQVVDVPGGPSRRPRAGTTADILAAALTQRERECLALLVAGLDTAAMMRQLGVSRTTVRTHLQAVLTKLCVHSRLEAASFAVRYNLVDPPQPVPSGRPAALSAAS